MFCAGTGRNVSCRRLRSTRSVRKASDFFLQKLGGLQWNTLTLGDLEPSYACVNFFPTFNSVSWWQAAFEWGSVQCSRRIFDVREWRVPGRTRIPRSHRTSWTPQTVTPTSWRSRSLMTSAGCTGTIALHWNPPGLRKTIRSNTFLTESWGVSHSNYFSLTFTCWYHKIRMCPSSYGTCSM